MDKKDWKLNNNRKEEEKQSEEQVNIGCNDRPLSDIIHLQYPISMECIIRCLDLKFIRGHLETWIGPSLIILNPYSNPFKLPFDTDQDENHSKFLKHKVREVLQELFDTKHSQTILFNGESGSGKSYNASHALYYLFSQTNRGLDTTSCFSKVSAALVVLQSLITVSTSENQNSSRVGLYIQNSIRDFAIYKTKINCIYIDHARLTEVKKNANNYHVFYEMLAGLTDKERSNLYLDTFTNAKEFYYLSMGNPPASPEVLKERFEKWRACLVACDVSFEDVTRILAAILLLGNITFRGSTGLELDIKGQNELKAVAALLGVSSITLYQGLSSRTYTTPEGVTVIPVSNSSRVHASRDALAQALYIRTIHTILRKANSLLKTQSARRKGRKLSNGSSKSEDRLSSHPSFNSCASERSTGVRNTSDGKQLASFVNILDLFGFENLKTNQLEQLAINLCSEAVQNYYNSHVLRSSVIPRSQSSEAGPIAAATTDFYHPDENDLRKEVGDNQYFDNRPIIHLISHPVCGIFTFLRETFQDNANPTKSLIHRIEASHHRNSFLSVNLDSPCAIFTIDHSSGRVVYDASRFIERNKDTIPDDIVWVFSQENCVFGFASHLFVQEIGDGPQGKLYKVLPHVGYGRRSNHSHFLTEDFCLKLEETFKKIALTKPHFVHCLKSNDLQSHLTFNTDTLRRQLSAMQLVESVNLMKTAPVHRIKYSVFNGRYKLLLEKSQNIGLNPIQISEVILNHLKNVSRNFSADDNSFNWVFRQKHLLFSELVRQELQAYKLHIFYQSAKLIQTHWRGFQCRKRWPFLLQHLQALRLRRMESLPTDNTVFVTTNVSKLDWKTVQQICAMYGIDPNNKPAMPPLRYYSVAGNMKVKFPQTRVVIQSYKIGKKDWLQKGDEVKVIGPSSSKAGHLMVQWQNQTHNIPHQALQLKTMGTLL